MKQKNPRSVWNIISIVMWSLLVLAECMAVFQIWKLNMLPTRYFLAFLAVVIVADALLGLMIRPVKTGKWQKAVKHTRQVIGYIFCVVIIALCMAGFSVLVQLNDTISTITTTEVSTLMDVYVLSDDPAQSIDDAADYVFGISLGTDEQINQAAVEAVQKQLSKQIAVQEYDSAFDMIDALYAKEVDAIIMDSAYTSVLDSVEAYSDFSERVRLIHDHVVKKNVVQVKPNSTVNQSPSGTQKLDPATTPFLLYISGNDARKPILADGGSDVNILLAVNPRSHQILMVNTPRDYYVENPASGNGSRDKLSHCGLNGIENCIGAITGLYDIEIDYYARINFSGFRTLVDAIGGVTVNSEVAFTAGGYYIQKGENYLDGAKALAFARERKNLPGGDNDRGKNQMRLITAMINQLSASSLLTNYSDILNSLEGMFATSMSPTDIAKLVQMQLSQMPSWEIYTFAVTGDNGNDSCWAVGGGYGYVMYPHENMVNKASELIGMILNGETISADDLVVG